MSNENSTTNIPRRKISSSSRFRKFSCITYLNETQLQVCLMKHTNQIRVYAYAYHDKDTKEDGSLKEPHYHLLLVTYNTCSLSAVRRWFSGYISNGKEITTTAQKCTDIYSSFDYLTHNTLEAKAENKYQYDKNIVFSNDFEYFKANEESEYDNITLATEMLLKGAKVRDLGKIFGRDFILHYGAIKQYCNDIWHMQDRNFSFEDLLNDEFEKEIIRLNL